MAFTNELSKSLGNGFENNSSIMSKRTQKFTRTLSSYKNEMKPEEIEPSISKSIEPLTSVTEEKKILYKFSDDIIENLYQVKKLTGIQRDNLNKHRKKMELLFLNSKKLTSVAEINHEKARAALKEAVKSVSSVSKSSTTSKNITYRQEILPSTLEENKRLLKNLNRSLLQEKMGTIISNNNKTHHFENHEVLSVIGQFRSEPDVSNEILNCVESPNHNPLYNTKDKIKTAYKSGKKEFSVPKVESSKQLKTLVRNNNSSNEEDVTMQQRDRMIEDDDKPNCQKIENECMIEKSDKKIKSCVEIMVQDSKYAYYDFDGINSGDEFDFVDIEDSNVFDDLVNHLKDLVDEEKDTTLEKTVSLNTKNNTDNLENNKRKRELFGNDSIKNNINKRLKSTPEALNKFSNSGKIPCFDKKHNVPLEKTYNNIGTDVRESKSCDRVMKRKTQKYQKFTHYQENRGIIPKEKCKEDGKKIVHESKYHMKNRRNLTGKKYCEENRRSILEENYHKGNTITLKEETKQSVITERKVSNPQRQILKKVLDLGLHLDLNDYS